MPTTVDITRKRGDTRRIAFIITQDGAPVNVSAWTGFRMTVDPSKAPETADTLVAQILGAVSTTGADGRVHFVPTGTIEPGKYYFDCQAIDDDGEKVTFAEGRYSVSQDITKT